MKNILQTIGNTPMIKLKSGLLVKLEGQNPGGSIKDRAALYMIEEAEKRGEVKEGKIILEATSGNMGISLAMIGEQKGYKVCIVMSEAMSEERKTVIKALGAELVLTDGSLGTRGAIEKAKEMAKDSLFWFSDQFNNKDNPLAYYHTLAVEILKEVPLIEVFVAGTGTSGTIMGVAKRLKEESPQTKIVAVTPPKGYKIQGMQNPEEDFIGDVFEKDLIDEYFHVSKEEAYFTAKEVARREGLFVGMSSGANIFAASKMSGNNVVTLMPDRGEKYLSTELFSK